MVLTGLYRMVLQVWQISATSSFPNGSYELWSRPSSLFLPIWWLKFIGVTTSETKNPSGLTLKLLRKFLSELSSFYGELLAAMVLSYSFRFPSICNGFWTGRIKWAAALINSLLSWPQQRLRLTSTLYSTGRLFISDCPWFAKSFL